MSRSIDIHNENEENKKLEEILVIQQNKKSYLNIWDEIPSLKDINLSFGMLQIFFIIGVTLGLSYLSYLLFQDFIYSIIIGILFTILFLIIFRDIFFSFYYSFKRFGEINLFKHFVFWRIPRDPLTLLITNKKDLRHIGLRMFKIGIIAENIKPNLNNLLKTLSILKIPFSYQIIQSPVYSNGAKSRIKISIYFTISYCINGIFTETKLETVLKALEVFSYAFKSTCIANIPHYRIEALSEDALIDAIHIVYFKKERDYKSDEKNKSLPNNSILKSLFIIILLVYIDYLLFSLKFSFFITLFINVSSLLTILFLFWREVIYYLSQKIFIKMDKQLLNPFNSYKFYFYKMLDDTLFVHINKSIFYAIKSFNLEFADIPQYYKKDQFIAHLDKFYRTMVSQQIPFTFTSMMSPIDYSIFRKEGIKKLNSYFLNKINSRNTNIEREQWLTMRSGIWRSCIVFSITEQIQKRKLNLSDFTQIEEKLELKCIHFKNVYISNLPNYHLTQLNKNQLFSSLIGIYLRNKYFRKAGTHLNYLLFQGKTLANLIEIANDFKKGIETKIAAEFNSPLDLKNFITIGKTINLEFLEEEVPAGFSKNQLKNLLITNGNFSNRENLLMKIVTGLIQKKEPSIIFDYTGNYSKLLNYFNKTKFQNDILYFSLGRSFRINIENSDIEYDNSNIDYLNLVLEAYSLIFKQDQNTINALKNSIKDGFNLSSLALEQKNDWKKNPYFDSIISLFTDFSEQTLVLQNRSEGFDEDIYPYQFITNNKTIIIDVSILKDLEQKIFISFIIICKLIHYINQFKDFIPKILIIPNSDIIFDNYYIEKNNNYSKISKFLEPLINNNLGLIISSNQIRYLHQNVFNYINNIITFRATDKRDIAILQNQMNLQELHGVGYYSSSRKESYQIDYLMNLKDNEIIIKRYDINQPFPALIDWKQLNSTQKILYSNIIDHMLKQGYDLRNKENILLKLSKKTLFESHFGIYISFIEELIKFLQILGNIDNIGNLYESKIKEELLKIIYPKASQKFLKNKKKITNIRDQIYELLISHGYLIENHPSKASGSQSIRSSFSVGPQYQISLSDYYKSKVDIQTDIKPSIIQKESDLEYQIEKIYPSFEENHDNDKIERKEFKEKLIECLSREFFYDLSEINSHIKKENYEEALILERDILRKFLVNLYNNFQSDQLVLSMKLDFEKVIDFFIKNTKDSFTRDYLNYLLDLCKLQDLQGEILVKRIKEIFDIYLEFFHQLEQDILD